MTQHVQQKGAVDNEFDAAKAIVETLRGLDKEKQERAIRFAGETLGLQAATVSAGAGPSHAVQDHVHGEKVETFSHGRVLDIRQFTESKAPKTDQQFAAVVAYYYRFEAPANERKEVIGVKDLLEAVRLAERKRPGSPLATLNNARNKGYLDSAGRAKFRINSVGENLVAMTLPGKDRLTPSRKGRGNTKKKKKGKAPAKKRGKTRK